ncbi:Radical SAM protein [Gammaproteobacteria bacterium]|jgi:hypothetical protein
MARLVLTNAYVVFASNDISQYVTSVSLSTSVDVIETTGLGSSARTRVGGLFDNQITLEFNQDFADNALEELINGTSLATTTVGTTVAMEIRPVNTTVSASNPKYTFNALISEWQPLSGAVGELVSVSATWPISGVITKAIS